MPQPAGGDGSSEKDDRSPDKKMLYWGFEYTMSPQTKRFLKDHRTPVCSMGASLVSTFVAFPLDLVKSRMQVHHTGFLETTIYAYRNGGIKVFWRGVVPPLMSIMAVRTVSMSAYQKFKYFFDDVIYKATGTSPLAQANAPNAKPTFHTILCFGLSGAASGALITHIACPFELTKINAQLAGSASGSMSDKALADVKSGAWRTAKRLVRDRGWRGLYCGYRLHLARDTIGTSAYFMTYESAKQLLSNSRGHSPSHPGAVAIAGSICGIVSWACVYPLDKVKTVFQKNQLSSGGTNTIRPKIEWFTKDSYRGLGVSAGRSAFVNMIFFSVFEAAKRRVNALETDD